MTARMDRALQHLHTLKACDISFFERDLLSHLTGTADVLHSWNADEDLVLAGLFHAVYLTEFFACNEPHHENRLNIQNIIGTISEEIVYSYCVMDRRSYISATEPQFFDNYRKVTVPVCKELDRHLVELIWANAFEQLQRDTPPFETRRAMRGMFDQSRGRVSQSALGSLSRLYEPVTDGSKT